LTLTEKPWSIMRVLVDALSVNNMSGRHVLLGHLSRLAAWTREEHQFNVLFHEANRDLCRDMGPNVDWHECPSYTHHWSGRTYWENMRLPKLAADFNTDFLFTPAGTIVPRLPLPQVSFAQNPWSLVRGLKRTAGEKLKAGLQRRGYKMAVKRADIMIFNSEFMQQAYRENAGFKEKCSEVVYQAIDESTHQAARLAATESDRQEMQILSVSVWAPHKGAETLLEALSLLRREYDLPARLVLAGPWPDKSYERMIRQHISARDLDESVEIPGYVSREELYRLYAQSRVFSLMSHCESFGIPAIEAQAFGTPVVSSNCCAIPEVCGAGGVFPDPGDAQEAALQICRLMTDQDHWLAISHAATQNASRFHWDRCSRKLMRIFEAI
jgi:glycosyltransferase involved in cell wall biosynthesis